MALVDTLIHAVIHSLEKIAGPNMADVKLRQVSLDVRKPLVITLADKLASLVSLNSGSLQYGQFSDDRHEGRFPGAVEQLLGKSTNKSFFSMTSVAMDELKKSVNGVNFATGGYVCFLVYASGGDDFLLVAMIKEREALQLTEDFEPKEIIEIDLSKLHQAARINLNRYRAAIAKGQSVDEDDDDAVDQVSPERTYLCFAANKSDGEVSNYFTEALGCVEGVSSKRATRALLGGIKRYIRKTEPLKGYAEQAKVAAVDYLMSRTDGTTVTIDNIITAVRRCVKPDLEPHFSNLKRYLSEDGERIPQTFVINHKVLKPLVQIKGGGVGWRISFENRLLGLNNSAIVYNPSDRSLTFTALPDKVIEEVELALLGRSNSPSNRDKK